jgi:hypothetical protein
LWINKQVDFETQLFQQRGHLLSVLDRERKGWTVVVTAYTDDKRVVVSVKLDVFSPACNDSESFSD